jgi:hypothetical protein
MFDKPLPLEQDKVCSFTGGAIMVTEEPPITTMIGLLEALCMDVFSTRKTGARVKSYRSDIINVYEYFDSGRGHSGAFSQEITPLNREVFDKAKADRYISGVLEPGYVSDVEFELTELGRRELFRLWEIKKQNEAVKAES